jgi:hypothetical protein
MLWKSRSVNKLVFGAFFTENTPYEQVLNEYLVPSCLRFGIEPHIVRTPNRGSWVKNVAEKPHAILHLLKEYVDNNSLLVFVDADATLEQYPIELEELSKDYDMGYHTLDWNSWYGYNNKLSIQELLTGTMILRNTVRVRQLCTEWYEKAKETNMWEQRVLQELIKKYKDIAIYDLPIEYCYMASLPDGRKPLIKCEPVIKHYQKSRELKRKL